MRYFTILCGIVTFALVVHSLPTFELFDEFEIENSVADGLNFSDEVFDSTAPELVANADEECHAEIGSPGVFNDQLQARGRVCKVRRPPTSSDAKPDATPNATPSGNDVMEPIYDLSKFEVPDKPRKNNKCPREYPVGVCSEGFHGTLDPEPDFVFSRVPHVKERECSNAYHSIQFQKNLPSKKPSYADDL